MKKIIYVFLPFFVYAFAAKAQSTEEAKVAAAVEALNKALVNADKNVLDSLTFEELSYGHSTGKFENKTQFIAAAAGANIDYLSIDISDQTIRVIEKTAVVRNMFAAKIISEGKPLEVKIATLMIWQKHKGKWKLLARQGFKI